MRLRRARPADVERIRAAYAREDVRSHIKDMPTRSTWWVIDDGGILAAFAAAERVEDEVNLSAAWTEPQYRGRGFQTRLIRARVRWAREVGAGRVKTYTWGGNLPSMRALMRCGFVPVARKWDGSMSWLYWSREL